MTMSRAARMGLVLCCCLACAVEAQLVKLLPADGAERDEFGYSIAIDNGVVAVGADLGGDNGVRPGSAYLFDASTGAQIAKLLASDGVNGDLFGYSIAIDSGVVAVGAPYDYYYDDDSGHQQGSAYLFDASTGNQIARLLPTDEPEWSLFGSSIAIDNGVVAVGALYGRDNDDLQTGSAYLFDASTGAQTAKLLASDGAAVDEFGFSIAIDNGVVAVGAIRDSDNGVWSGSAYLFDASTGTQIAKLLPSDGASDEHFGWSIAIGNGVVAVGSTSSAYLFDASTGAQLFKLLPSGGASGFGWSIAIDNGVVAVGTIGDDSVYLFNASTGAEIAKLLPSDGAPGDYFGWSIAIDNGVVAVGAPYDDDNGQSSGSAYLFDVDIDTDGDGLLDDWEINGIPYTTADGTTGRYILDSTGDGVRDCHPEYKDLFIEVDSMQGLHFPNGAKSDLEVAFYNAPVDNPPDDTGYVDTGIKIHIVVDETTIPFEAETDFPLTGWPIEMAAIKLQWFGTLAEQQGPDAEAILQAKAKAYRYCIMVNKIKRANGTYIGGKAEISGDDFVVTYFDGRRESLAAAFMHELGHTLGLDHGGADAINMKPNYPSIMNYALAYRKAWSRSFWALDYSRETLAPIFEDDLDENTSIGDGGTGYYRNWVMPYYSVVTDGVPCYAEFEWGQPFVAYASLDPGAQGVDYNLDCDTADPSVQADLNYYTESGLPGSDAPSPGDPLLGQNDWDRIVLPITEGGEDFGEAPAEDELTDEGQQFIEDNFPTPPDICEADWNNDGLVNTQDVIGFLNDWAGEHYRADWNVDGIIDTRDFIAYLNDWAAGCP